MKTRGRTTNRNLAERYHDDLFYHLGRSLNTFRFKTYEGCPEGQGLGQLAWNKASFICEHIDPIDCC